MVQIQIPQEMLSSIYGAHFTFMTAAFVMFASPISLKRRDELLVNIRNGQLMEVQRMDVVIYRECRNN